MKYFKLTLLAATLGVSSSLSAYELYNNDTTRLDFNVNAMFGVFHSQKSYASINPDQKKQGSKSWREGSIAYGFNGQQKVIDNSKIDFGLSWVSTATWGDGDAAGLTSGKERRTHIEDAWIGWSSGLLTPFLGEDGVKISVGRQTISLGSGFLIHGDPLSMGEGITGAKQLNRGGAYYLAPRNSFGQTGVLSLGGAEGLRGDLMYLKSSNPAQAKSKLHVLNFEYVADEGSVGVSVIRGHDIDKKYADDFQLQRKGMKTYSLRGNHNFGIENLNLSAEYAKQVKKKAMNADDKAKRAHAWYTQASWTFSDVLWEPTITYRYSRFSKNFDALFYGLSSGFGTWFQGEVAGNYAGPFNNNNTVHHIGAGLQVHDDISLGLLVFKFNTLDKKEANLAGKELNIFAEWGVNDRLTVIPLIGWYDPKKDIDSQGTQFKNKRNNFYSQLLFVTQF